MDKKAVASDLKKIYQSNTIELAQESLDEFEIAWGDKYPDIVKSWRNNWEKITPFLQFPKEIQRVIYTTNIVESLNSTLRKAVRNRGHFSTEDGIMKVLYLAIRSVSKKWNMPIKVWKQALNPRIARTITNASILILGKRNHFLRYAPTFIIDMF